MVISATSLGTAYHLNAQCTRPPGRDLRRVRAVWRDISPPHRWLHSDDTNHKISDKQIFEQSNQCNGKGMICQINWKVYTILVSISNFQNVTVHKRTHTSWLQIQAFSFCSDHIQRATIKWKKLKQKRMTDSGKCGHGHCDLMRENYNQCRKLTTQRNANCTTTPQCHFCSNFAVIMLKSSMRTY